MSTFQTVFSSNSPVDCYLLKGRLETEGIPCFIYDEFMIWVHPFRAVALGGVKLKVAVNQVEKAVKVLEMAGQGILIDEVGEYRVEPAMEQAMQREYEALEIRKRIRSNPELLNTPAKLQSNWLTKDDIRFIVESEQEYEKMDQNQLNFTWKEFLYELFDYNRSVIKYLRRRPPEFYHSRDLVKKYHQPEKPRKVVNCPNCKSNNVSFGAGIDRKWDVLYLLFSLLLYAPFPPYRKNYHCYNCGQNFKRKKRTS